MCPSARRACVQAAEASAEGARDAAAERERKRWRSTDMTMSLPSCLPHSTLRCAECAEKISSAINHLIEAPRNVVHVLPYVVNRMKRDRAKEAWRPGQKDVRVICDCQVHARKQRVWWRRGLRSMQNASTRAKSGVALLVGLPLVFGASWVPMDAVNSYAAVTRKLT